MKSEKLSIIIPVYNEEKTILKILESVRKVKFGIKKEIIIINDGSKDNSKKIIENYLRKNNKENFIFVSKENEGKGSAIRKGFEKASGKYVIMQDSDLEYNPNEIGKILNEIKKGKNEVVYGSRMLKKNPTSHWIYYFGNWFLSLATSILYGHKISDMETCYKMIPLKIIKELKLKANKFDIEPEITAKILKLGYSIKEIPISYSPRNKKEGKKIEWRDGFTALWVLIYWKFKKI